MWRRALLAAAAVSYLICVLIMSGMQKEDLDASMLRKLERHNVNFDDINNERLRQQCSAKNNDFTTVNKTYKMKEGYISTTEHKIAITTENPITSATFNMESILNYLKTQKENSAETTTEKTARTRYDLTTSLGDLVKNQPKLDVELLRRYIELQSEKRSFYKLNNDSETVKHDLNINLKTNERNTNVRDEGVFKLFQNYIYQKQKISTTTEYTTTRYTLDIQSVYKQIDDIIENGSNTHNEENITKIKHFNDVGQNYTKYTDFTSPVDVTKLNEQKYLAGKKLFQSFYNFINEMSQFKNITSQSFPIFDDKTQFEDDHKTKTLKPLYQNEKEKYNESTTTLTPDLVNKIAEAVKEVIIKDLHNELAGIYLKTTQTTKITIPTTTKSTDTPPTTHKSRTQEKDISIMDKFMDLYEQIKSLKQAKSSLKANEESSTLVNYLKQQIKSPANTALFIPPLNGFQTPDTKASISSIGNYYPKQIFNHNPYLPMKEMNHQIPITIQTNSVEIQPLAVRISKPESMIRQNIVVQTKHRFQDRKEHLKPISQRGITHLNLKTPIKTKNRAYKDTPFKRYDGYKSARYQLHPLPREENQREDIIRFRMRDNGNSRFDTDYYEKINFGNDRNTANEQRAIIRSRNVPRFHERLERMDTGSDGVQVVSDIEIKDKREDTANYPPRQQLSLIDMKKGLSYDDTHFKNFLNTQQKVTDMLEKILATRPKSMPRSVETI